MRFLEAEADFNTESSKAVVVFEAKAEAIFAKLLSLRFQCSIARQFQQESSAQPVQV